MSQAMLVPACVWVGRGCPRPTPPPGCSCSCARTPSVHIEGRLPLPAVHPLLAVEVVCPGQRQGHARVAQEPAVRLLGVGRGAAACGSAAGRGTVGERDGIDLGRYYGLIRMFCTSCTCCAGSSATQPAPLRTCRRRCRLERRPPQAGAGRSGRRWRHSRHCALCDRALREGWGGCSGESPRGAQPLLAAAASALVLMLRWADSRAIKLP